MINYLKKFDVKGLEYINTYCQNNMFDKIMPRITMLGDLGIIWFVISILLLIKVDYRIMGIMTIGAIILTTIIGEGIIKHVVRRQRPFVVDDDDEVLINKPITYSFPSGHTASSFAALIVFSQTNFKLGLIVSPIATLIAFSRLYLKVHYPTDVIFGIMLGCTCGLTVVNIVSRFV